MLCSSWLWLKFSCKCHLCKDFVFIAWAKMSTDEPSPASLKSSEHKWQWQEQSCNIQLMPLCPTGFYRPLAPNCGGKRCGCVECFWQVLSRAFFQNWKTCTRIRPIMRHRSTLRQGNALFMFFKLLWCSSHFRDKNRQMLTSANLLMSELFWEIGVLLYNHIFCQDMLRGPSSKKLCILHFTQIIIPLLCLNFREKQFLSSMCDPINNIF